MSTVLRPNPSPFPRAVKRRATAEEIDPDLIAVEHNIPPPAGMAPRGQSKYHKKFVALRPGSALRCEPNEVAALASELRGAIKSEKYPAMTGCTVVQRRNCKDGHGRVWLTKKELE
jgi:hypothetical protein